MLRLLKDTGIYYYSLAVWKHNPDGKFHPDDGVVVRASTCPLLNSGNGLNYLGTDKDNFGNLVKGRTDAVVPDAWGGYMDAGDWDRRAQTQEWDGDGDR